MASFESSRGNILESVVAALKAKEPEFTIAGIPVHFHQLAPKDKIWVVCGGEIIFVHKDGEWKKWKREQFEKIVQETVSEMYRNR